MNFEKGHESIDPTKQQIEDRVNEIQIKVEEVVELSNAGDSSQQYSFKNQKIIAWLLNRNKEAQSGERAMFF